MYYAIAICIFIGCVSVLTTVASQSEGNCDVCGNINPLIRMAIIIGGKRVEPFNKYPWVISLKDKFKEESDNWVKTCGGAIISDYFILTAAHCVYPYDQWDVRFLDNSTGKIAEIFVHPGYQEEAGDHDIALLKLQNPIQCGPSKSPICLPSPNTPSPIVGSKMGVNGWGWGCIEEGFDNGGSSVSEFLNEVELTFVEPRTCDSGLKDKTFNSEIFLCLSGKGVANACSNDSGGIGYIKIGNCYIATGVLSYLYSPVGDTTRTKRRVVLTKISAYIDWITKVSGVTPPKVSGY